MPKPSSSKVNRLLKMIRDPKLSAEKQNQALDQLETEVNQYSTSQDSRFTASLSTFEQQWSRFEKGQEGLTSSLDTVLSGTIDSDEVNLLMQQVQDEVRLERSSRSDISVDQDLEKRLQRLGGVARESRRSSLTISTPVDSFEALESLENTSASADLDLGFLADIHDSISNTEAQLQTLEDELEAMFDSDSVKYQPSVIDSVASDLAQRSSKSDVTMYTENYDSIASPSVKTPSLTSPPSNPEISTGSSFITKIKSFLNSIVNFVKTIASDSVAPEVAVDRLTKANRELDGAASKLNRAKATLLNASDTIQSRSKELQSRNAAYQETGEKLKGQRALLQKCMLKTDINPQQKLVMVKKIKAEIADSQQEFRKNQRLITQATSQLTRASALLQRVQPQLEDSTQRYKQASSAIKKGVDVLEKSLAKHHASLTEQKQHRMKNLLQQSRAKCRALDKPSVLGEDSGMDRPKPR